ncbi:MAG: oligosaccharide flippase family protein [Candidatus Dormibacteraeota bacterium]|nr:oligosaccharide flippase family protein [Candidatus Dormibacteraeota bacterium]
MDEAPPISRPSLFRNMLINVGGRGLLTLLALVVTPVLVRRLGTDGYGIYVIAFSLGGLLSILDLGLTPAVVRLLSRAWHLQDKPRMEQIIGTAITTYLAVGVVFGGIVAMLVPWLTTSVLHIAPNLRSAAQVALWLSTAGFLLNLMYAVFNAVPVALERFDLTVLRAVAVSLLTSAAVIVYALTGGGLVGVMVINVVGNAVAVALFIAVSRFLLPGLHMRPQFNRDIFLAIARFSGFKFAGSLGGLLTYRFDQIAIGAFLGVRAAGVYVVPATAATRVVALLTDMVLPLFPRISKVTADPAAIRSLLLRTTRMMALLAAPAFTVLFVFADPIIRAWIGGDEGRVLAIEGASTLRWLAAASLIQAIAVVPVIVSEAAGKPEINNGFAVLSAIINVPLVLILVPRLGIEGAAIAFFINSATQTVVFIFYAARRFAQVTVRQLIAEALARPLVAAGIAGAVGALIHPQVTGDVSLILALLLVFGLYAVLARLMSAITGEDREYLAAFVSRLHGPLNRDAAQVR